MKHVWGFKEKASGEIYGNLFHTRYDARSWKDAVDCLDELKVVKLVPVEEKKQEQEEIDTEKLASITENSNGRIKVDGKAVDVIEPRHFDEFAGKAVWLADTYDWKIVKDSCGELCLLAIKKESK